MRKFILAYAPGPTMGRSVDEPQAPPKTEASQLVLADVAVVDYREDMYGVAAVAGVIGVCLLAYSLIFKK